MNKFKEYTGERSEYVKPERKYANELIDELDDRQKKVIKLRFSDDPASLDELGKQYGRTRERIRQLQNVAIDDMGKIMRSKLNESNPEPFCNKYEKMKKLMGGCFMQVGEKYFILDNLSWRECDENEINYRLKNNGKGNNIQWVSCA